MLVQCVFHLHVLQPVDLVLYLYRYIHVSTQCSIVCHLFRATLLLAGYFTLLLVARLSCCSLLGYVTNELTNVVPFSIASALFCTIGSPSNKGTWNNILKYDSHSLFPWLLQSVLNMTDVYLCSCFSVSILGVLGEIEGRMWNDRKLGSLIV